MAVWDELKQVPAVVRSGQTLRHGLLLGNLTGRDLQIATNGQVTAQVVDPWTGEVAGGWFGIERAVLVWFRVAPGETGRIPLLIGTASFTPRLGYMIPAGDWGIQATLKLGPSTQSALRSQPGSHLNAAVFTRGVPLKP